MVLEKLKIEFFATFVLVYITGLFLIEFHNKNVDILGLSTGFFIIHLILIWATKEISGAHLNPIISLSLAISGHITFKKALLYSLFQLAASLSALSFLRMGIPNEIAQTLSAKTMFGFPLNHSIHPARQIGFEIFGSFFLVLFYYLLVIERPFIKHVYAVGLAAFYFASLPFMFFFSGAGLNPARMIAYCLVGGQPWLFYIWFVGPFVGGIFGGLLGNLFLSENSTEMKKRVREEKKNAILELERERIKYN